MRKKIWVSGPSGAGKTYLGKRVRHFEIARSFDLDFVGFRTKSEAWHDWTIPPSIFDVIALSAAGWGTDFVALGCDSHFDKLIAGAAKNGFAPIMLIPSVSDLARQRAERGDDLPKVKKAENDVRAWTSRARDWEIEVFTSVHDILDNYGWR